MRGIVSDEIKAKSLELIGYEISQEELRLLPYIHFCLINNGWFENLSISEMRILKKWEEMGFIRNTFSQMSQIQVSKFFYDVMNELLFLGYVRVSQIKMM